MDDNNHIKDLNIEIIDENSSCCCNKGAKAEYQLKRNNSLNNQHTLDDDDDENGKNCCVFLKKINFKKIKRSLPAFFVWLLLLSTGVFYAVFVLYELYLTLLKRDLLYTTLLCTGQLVLFLYTAINFLIAVFRDPGKYKKEPEDYSEDSFKSPLYKNILVQNILIKTKWCTSCNFYRPLRCSHCSVCNACIEQFDHHCPWLANCIGKRNYRFFLQFLFFLILHMISIFTTSLIAVLHLPLLTVTSITAIVLIIIIGLLIVPVSGLFAFHIMLVCKGRTTNEQVTGKYKGLHLFNKGCCVNFQNILCSSFTPSLSAFKSKYKYEEAVYRAELEMIQVT